MSLPDQARAPFLTKLLCVVCTLGPLQKAASDQATTTSQRSALPADRAARHAQICHILRTGRVVDAIKQENGFGHISFVVTLEDKHGNHMKALFK